MYPDSEKGKCISCGFLATRPITPTPALLGYYEFTERDRQTGDVKLYVEAVARRVDAMPVCFRHAANIEAEATQLCSTENNLTSYDARVKSISGDRKCKDWYPYTPGIEPKDHLNKLEMERLEEQRRDFELRLEKERKEFDLRLFEISQKVQEDSTRVVQSSDRFNRRVTWFFIVLTILEVVATILTLAFPNGIPWLVGLVGGNE